jgi:hypothetical protein
MVLMLLVVGADVVIAAGLRAIDALSLILCGRCW